jgi:putative redox protein
MGDVYPSPPKGVKCRRTKKVPSPGRAGVYCWPEDSLKHEINCAWTGDMAFEADIMGHRVRMDIAEADGGRDSGVRPKPLILASLAGCTGVDVVSILRKMRQNLSWFNIRAEGELSQEQPARYVSFRLVYEFKASDGLDPAKVRQAVELSQDKYCGVTATLKSAGPVDWEIAYL